MKRLLVAGFIVFGACLVSRAYGTDPDLRACVQDMETSGVSGRWFTAESPFDRKSYSFYLVQKLPAHANPKSALFLMRLEHTRAFLAGLIDKNVPVVLGVFPLELQVAAAALNDEFPLAAAALKEGGITGRRDIIVIAPDAGRFVFAHELRHWEDFEEAHFTEDFVAALAPFFNADYLSNEDKQWLLRIVWELRGHNAQILQAMHDAAAGLPCLDRAGNLGCDYQFEKSFAVMIFRQAYDSKIAELLSKIRSHDERDPGKLADMFARFESPEKSDNLLSLKEYVKK